MAWRRCRCCARRSGRALACETSLKRGSRSAYAAAIAALRVRRAVVDHDAPRGRSKVCAGDRVEARPEVRLDVVDRDDDADRGTASAGELAAQRRRAAAQPPAVVRRDAARDADAAAGRAAARRGGPPAPSRRLAATIEDCAIASASRVQREVARRARRRAPRAPRACRRRRRRAGAAAPRPPRRGRARARARRARPSRTRLRCSVGVDERVRLAGSAPADGARPAAAEPIARRRARISRRPVRAAASS